MSHPYLSIHRVGRTLANGSEENIQLEFGVNLIVGRPNTGKTKWLQTLDYLLGDSGENPFESDVEDGLSEKYVAASAQIQIGDDLILIERKWREFGAKGKVFVDGKPYLASEFQQLLLTKLQIPLLNFPKGNPLSGQTWPELSFRMLLRHIYRRQRFWTSIVDQQPDAEQLACLLQFLGIAEHIFNDDYDKLMASKMEVMRLKARREQYGQTLDDLARDVLSEPGQSVSVNEITVGNAKRKNQEEIRALEKKRSALIVDARNKTIPANQRSKTEEQGQERVGLLAALEDLSRRSNATAERLDEMRRYKTELVEELDRMSRATEAGEVLADLKITHCPACDQLIAKSTSSTDDCFLCHQKVRDEPLLEELGAVRLKFESQRLNGELREADELLLVLSQDASRIANQILETREKLQSVEAKLAPARSAVGALIQEEVSSIDMNIGELTERNRQLDRLLNAIQLGEELTRRIIELEKIIRPLQERVDNATRSIDFDAAATKIENGMNDYLGQLNELRPDVWRHSAISLDLSRSDFSIRVGGRRWHSVLGGTDTLYFLMAYQYGLLCLSNDSESHYPGLSIIDLPGEFSGEAVEDKENFIVQPFIELLKQREFQEAQVLITGASFAGLEDVHRLRFTHVYVA